MSLGPIIAVIDTALATPPASPVFGDTYLVPAAPTGAWAGSTNKIALFTSHDWVFVPPRVGQLLFSEATGGFYHYTAAGTWVAGTGTASFGSNSVPLSAAINFGRCFIVENQTTNAPPASPAVGVAYIIGPSPSGAWAGKSLQLAICEITGTWTYYPASEGMKAYDKALDAEYTYTGTAWRTTASAFSGVAQASDNAQVALSGTGGASTSQSGSETTAPVNNTSSRSTETLTLTYASHVAGKTIRVHYQASFHIRFTGSYTPGSGAGGTIRLFIGLFVDSETTARDWVVVNATASSNGVAVVLTGPEGPWNHTFTTALADTNSHTFKISFIAAVNGSMGSSPTESTTHPTVRNRRLFLEETV